MGFKVVFRLGVSLVLLGSLAAGCGARVEESTGTDGPMAGAPGKLGTPAASRAAEVVEGQESPSIPFVSGRLLSGPGRGTVQLAEESGAWVYGASPLASLSPDGGMVVYNAWRKLIQLDPELSLSDQGIEIGTPVGVPSVRVLDLATGEDSLVAEGASTAAWRQDGALAYFKGTEEADRIGRRYTGQVLVRAGLDQPAEQWTDEEAKYVVVAWAGSHLLVYRVTEGEHLDLLVLDGPGVHRVLGDDAFVIAVSPDGARLLLGQDSQHSVVRLIEVAEGREVATLDLSQAVQPAIDWLTFAGSWAGSRAVAEGGLAGGAAALVVLRIGSTDITVEQVLSFDSARFPNGLHEPQLVGEDGTRVVAWAPLPPVGGPPGRPVLAVDCDLLSGRCKTGQAGLNAQPVHTPARPISGEGV